MRVLEDILTVNSTAWMKFDNIAPSVLTDVDAIIFSKNTAPFDPVYMDVENFAKQNNIMIYEEVNIELPDILESCLFLGDKVLYCTGGFPAIKLCVVAEKIENAIPEYRAYWKDRMPQLGMCKVIMINFEADKAEISNGVRVYPKLSEIILMRYTGFKDKAGRKLFFGDIFYDETLDKKFIFTDYLEVSLLNIPHWSKTFCKENLNKNVYTVQIMGNIHENPELTDQISNWDCLIEM